MVDHTNSLTSGMSFTLHSIARDCFRLRRSIQPISERYHGYLHQRHCNTSTSPFVLLLGSNSSGKSNFINNVLNRPIQAAGPSSVDDCFTVIKSGLEDFDGSGQSVAGDPDLGFNEGQDFGPTLRDHTQLKVRANVAIKDVMFVDGPNMVDECAATFSSDKANVKRDYSMNEACRWYAERADVVLLFVDPNKSGSQGETLDSLKSALKGLGNKVLIILNKVDPFQSLQEFIQSYGTLCWNLSKTVPMSDLPKIHTICPPNNDDWCDGTDITHASAVSEVTSDEAARNSLLMSSYCDQSHMSLHESREAVVKEIINAPHRRVSNDVTHLSEDVSALLAHCHIMDVLSSQYQNKLLSSRVWVGATAFTSVTAALAAPLVFDAYRGTEAMAAFTSSLMSCARELNNVVRELTTSETVRGVVRDWTKWAVSKPKETFVLATSVCGALVTLAANMARSVFLSRTAANLACRESYQQAMDGIQGQTMSDAVKEQLASVSSSVTPALIRSHISQAQKEDLEQLVRMSLDVEQLKDRAHHLSEDQRPMQHRSSPVHSLLSSHVSVFSPSLDAAAASGMTVVDGDCSVIEGCVEDDSVSYLSMTSDYGITQTVDASHTSVQSNEVRTQSSDDTVFWDDFYLQMGQPAPLLV